MVKRYIPSLDDRCRSHYNLRVRYVMVNKPYGVRSTFTDPAGRATLRSLGDLPRGVYAAGRLDADSEGLLLLTDDGALAHRLTDPRYGHPRTYLAQVEGLPSPEALAALRKGVVIGGVRTRPAQVELLEGEPVLPPRARSVTPHGPTTWLRLVLREGRNRQVRHMTAAVGYPTLRLVRVALGPLELGDLAPGAWRTLSPAEVRALKAFAGQRRA